MMAKFIKKERTQANSEERKHQVLLEGLYKNKIIEDGLKACLKPPKSPYFEHIRDILQEQCKNIKIEQIEDYLMQCEKRNQRTKHDTKGDIYSQLKVCPEIITTELIFRNFFYYLLLFKSFGPTLIEFYINELNQGRTKGNIKEKWSQLEQNIDIIQLQDLTRLAFKYYRHWHQFSIVKLQIMRLDKLLEHKQFHDEKFRVTIMEQIIRLKISQLTSEIQYQQDLQKYHKDFSRTVMVQNEPIKSAIKQVESNLSEKIKKLHGCNNEIHKILLKKIPNILEGKESTIPFIISSMEQFKKTDHYCNSITRSSQSETPNSKNEINDPQKQNETKKQFVKITNNDNRIMIFYQQLEQLKDIPEDKLDERIRKIKVKGKNIDFQPNNHFTPKQEENAFIEPVDQQRSDNGQINQIQEEQIQLKQTDYINQSTIQKNSQDASTVSEANQKFKQQQDKQEISEDYSQADQYQQPIMYDYLLHDEAYQIYDSCPFYEKTYSHNEEQSNIFYNSQQQDP